ncbi:MAG: helix-turn-helix domain-containing protein [Pseudomonadota bacterium]
MSDQLFCALLKYWRGRRGYSQLDLALAADVSARHISFLESGRAQASADMVLRLMSTMSVPLRDQNHVLRAAGFAARFPDPGLDLIPAAVELAIEQMMRQQAPFPLTVLNADYDIVRCNDAATAVFSHFVAEPDRLTNPLNLFDLIFDPHLSRPFVNNWPIVARHMVARLHREALQYGDDARRWALLERVLQYPAVPASWRQPDFSTESAPTLNIELQRDGLRLGFLTTLTVFSAPQQVTLDELRIESYFPLDDATRRSCEQLARSVV